MPGRRRADLLVVERGLAESRTRAQALILAGDVVASGGGAGERRVEKPGDLLKEDVELRLKGESLPYVSRGGLKLQAALDHFGIDVTGSHALDLGASTGGFTDCLLQRGASHVTAVDVGYGQLHEKLRRDPRVRSIERTNARALPPDLGTFDLLVADVSFISLRLIVPDALAHLAAGAGIVLLVKPQFECGREWIEKGGVVRDPAARLRAVESIEAMLREHGCEVTGHIESPIRGPAGNVEFLVAARAEARRIGPGSAQS
jgi:23S rRNA (cytidine1920-2'-O)/16S rRNA (cytidine1409-2'-O)-methyltransferase